MAGPSPPSERPSSSAALIASSSSASLSSLQRSQVTHQVILDEDEYASALSSIVRRDFFPHLDRLAATNDYLGALEAGDPESVARALRRLREVGQGGIERTRRSVARKKDVRGDSLRHEGESARAASSTPFINRTPFARGDIGERSWDTPFSIRGADDDGATVRREASLDDDDEDATATASKRRRLEDLTSHAISASSGIDAFQSTYASEDNASFLRLLREENLARRERHSWAFEAEQKHESKRLKVEQARRKGLIEAGGHVDKDDGLMGKNRKQVVAPKHPLALEARTDGEEVEMEMSDAQNDRRQMAITGDAQTAGTLQIMTDSTNSGSSCQIALRSENDPQQQTDESTPSTTAMTVANALPRAPDENGDDNEEAEGRALVEFALRPDSHLAVALAEAGLPSTAFAARMPSDDKKRSTRSSPDQAVVIVPAREVASGAGDGLGRGQVERQRREMIEAEVWADQEDTRAAIVPDWKYKARNSLMFPPDVDVDPNVPKQHAAALATEVQRQAPKHIKHVNTRLPDDDEEDDGAVAGSSRSSRRASSPSRSRVAAAIHGTPYPSSDRLPTFGSFALVPDAPSPSPSSLGPAAVSELMTWGSILATPRALDSSTAEEGGFDRDPRGYRFSIAPEGGRDRLGRKLADDASRSMRQRAKGYGSSSNAGAAGLGLLVRPMATGKAPSSSSKRRGGDMGPPSSTRSPHAASSLTPRRTAQDLTPAGRTLLERTRAGSATPARGTSLTTHQSSSSSAGRHSRQEAMERAGGWGIKSKASASAAMGVAKSKPPAERTWTPSPAVRRDR